MQHCPGEVKKCKWLAHESPIAARLAQAFVNFFAPGLIYVLGHTKKPPLVAPLKTAKNICNAIIASLAELLAMQAIIYKNYQRVKYYYEYQVVSGIDAGLPDERRKSAADRMSDEWRSKRKIAFSARFCAAWMYFRHDPIFGVSR
jgi:hypothetical protein